MTMEMEWGNRTRQGQGKERGVPLYHLLPSMGADEAEKPVVYSVLEPQGFEQNHYIWRVDIFEKSDRSSHY